MIEEDLYMFIRQLNPEKLRGDKLEEKDDTKYYYLKDKKLQVYAKDMINKVAYHNLGYQIRQNNAYIGEGGLYNVSKDYKKIILKIRNI
jgi:hypothetical protein